MDISPNQAPDPKDVEDALRSLNVSRIREGRGHVATDETAGNDPLDFGRDFAPSIVPPDENAQIGTEELASKASLGKRPCRSYYWQHHHRDRRHRRMAGVVDL